MTISCAIAYWAFWAIFSATCYSFVVDSRSLTKQDTIGCDHCQEAPSYFYNEAAEASTDCIVYELVLNQECPPFSYDCLMSSVPSKFETSSSSRKPLSSKLLTSQKSQRHRDSSTIKATISSKDAHLSAAPLTTSTITTTSTVPTTSIRSDSASLTTSTLSTSIYLTPASRPQLA